MYITHLSRRLQSSCNVRNYVSRIWVLHWELELSPTALDSFQVQSLLRAADISMRTPTLRHLPIPPDLLHRLYLLTPSLGPLGPSMLVCLTFVFLPCSGRATWAHHHPLPLTCLGTPTGVTFSSPPPPGLRLNRPSAITRCCQFWRYRSSGSL